MDHIFWDFDELAVVLPLVFIVNVDWGVMVPNWFGTNIMRVILCVPESLICLNKKI